MIQRKRARPPADNEDHERQSLDMVRRCRRQWGCMGKTLSTDASASAPGSEEAAPVAGK
jgi:hypothetical protein